MKTSSILGATGAILSTVALLAFAPMAKATTFPDTVYTVTLNLNSLAGYTGGPFSLDLQLAEGSGNVVNTVTLSNFIFTGGTASGTSNFTTGGVSGSLAGSLVLTNSSFDNEFAEAFSAGVTSISFKVDQTPNAEVVGTGTPIPDQFNVSLVDSNVNYIPTADPSGANTLISSDLGPGATVSQYSIIATPEPGSAGLSMVVAGAMLGMVLLRRRSIV